MPRLPAVFVCAAALAATIAPTRPCRAQELDPLRPVRTGGEIAGFLALDFGLLFVTPPPAGDPPGNVKLIDKLTLKAWSFDASSFETNFSAHPFAGTFYYTTARSNRYGALASLGWASAAALAWELAEFPENVSFNDLVVTPVAGTSIGESLVQLSQWIGRKRGSNSVLSTLLFPMKALNGGALAEERDDDALAADVRLVGGAKWHGGPELGVAMSTRLVHVPGFGQAGRGTRLGIGGDLTGLSLSARGGSSGGTHFRFTASAALFSMYQRDIGAGGDGWDFLATGGVAYDLRRHVWQDGRTPDAWSSVHVPHLGLQLRRLDGDLRVTVRADLGVTLCGARSLALDAAPGSVSIDTLTATQRAWGYTMGWGLSAAPAVEIAYGPLSLEGGAALDTRYGLDQADPWPDHHPSATITDSWSSIRGGARLRLPWSDLQISASVQRDLRRGSDGAASRTQAETIGMLGIGFALQ